MAQTPEDRDTTFTQRDAPSRMTVGGTAGPGVGDPLPPNRTDPTSGKSAAPLSGVLLWTVGILLIVAIIAIVVFAL
jgi:hypothetical protein